MPRLVISCLPRTFASCASIGLLNPLHEKSAKDLAEIVSQVAKDSASAAGRFGEALLAQVELLGRFPRMGGTVGKHPRIRTLVHSPIVVYYRVDEDRQMVEVLHFRHQARR